MTVCASTLKTPATLRLSLSYIFSYVLATNMLCVHHIVRSRPQSVKITQESCTINQASNSSVCLS